MTYNRYPLSMHKGQWPNIQSEYVYDEAGEKALADKGYGIKAPWVPDVPEAPAVEPKPSELAERISALESQILELKAAVEQLSAKKGKR